MYTIIHHKFIYNNLKMEINQMPNEESILK